MTGLDVNSVDGPSQCDLCPPKIVLIMIILCLSNALLSTIARSLRTTEINITLTLGRIGDDGSNIF